MRSLGLSRRNSLSVKAWIVFCEQQKKYVLFPEAIDRYLYRRGWYLVDSLARLISHVLLTHHAYKKIDCLIPCPDPEMESDDYPAISLLVDWVSQLTTIPRIIAFPCDKITLTDRASLVQGRHVCIIVGKINNRQEMEVILDLIRSQKPKKISVLILTDFPVKSRTI